MKPVLATEIIEIRYWKCGVPEHRHKKERFAVSCIAKQQEKASRKNGRRQERTIGEQLEVLSDFQNGTSIAALSEKLQISYERTRQILARAKRMEKQHSQAQHDKDALFFSLLPTRTANALRNDNYKTMQAVRVALQNGTLDIPNIGKKGRDLIAQALANIDP